MITCKFDPSLPAKLKKYFDDPDKLQKSIAVKFNSVGWGQGTPYSILSEGYLPNAVYSGWGNARGSAGWDTRWKAWHTKALQVDLGRISGAPIYFLVGKDVVKAYELFNDEKYRGIDKANCAIPIFTSLLEKDPEVTPRQYFETVKARPDSVDKDFYYDPTNLCQEAVTTRAPFIEGEWVNAVTERFNASIENKTNQPKEETNKMKQLFDKVLGQNKDAVALAGKLSVGKAGNAFLLSQVTGKFPWYARLFGAKAKVQDNPFAKLASAQVANALAIHFAPGNKKIAYVADAMLQEAMVDLITNSNQLQSLIDQLEGFAGTITDAIE